jgi:hypothetical protein
LKRVPQSLVIRKAVEGVKKKTAAFLLLKINGRSVVKVAAWLNGDRSGNREFRIESPYKTIKAFVMSLCAQSSIENLLIKLHRVYHNFGILGNG